jgi:hypothetical protein
MVFDFILQNKFEIFVISIIIVITQFWVIPQNSFFSKSKSKNKIRADNVEKAGRREF